MKGTPENICMGDSEVLSLIYNKTKVLPTTRHHRGGEGVFWITTPVRVNDVSSVRLEKR